MAYKVFTNGSPLPASDLNTYLMNQSVMVFADSTARSAALTAPTEGMVTYLEDTGLVYVYNGSSWVDINDNSGAIPKSTVTTAGDLIVADGNASVIRLGIGANGTVLQSNGTTATWATPSSGGGMTLISSTSLSGSSVTLSSIPGTYKDLILRIISPNLNTGFGRFRYQFNSDTGSNYWYLEHNAAGNAGTNATFLDTTNATFGPTRLNSVHTLFLPSYTQASHKLAHNTAMVKDVNGEFHWSVGTWANTAAISSITIAISANTLTAGTALLYGVS